MRRTLFALLATLTLLVAAPAAAFAGSPHFVDDQSSFTVSGATLTAQFKEAGLGSELQVHVVLTATAACVNPGGQKPQATNKQSVSADGVFPVQSGQATGSLSVTAVFQPPCSPPMSVAFSDVTLTDTTNNITITPRKG
jgi:hypothetical protein